MKNLKNKDVFATLLSILLSSLTVFAYGLNLSEAVVPNYITKMEIYKVAFFRLLTDIVYSVEMYNWFAILLCLAVAYLYRKRIFIKTSLKRRIEIIVVSAFIVFLLMLCHSYNAANSWDMVFGDKTIFAKAIIKIMGFTPMVYIVLDYLTSFKANVEGNDLSEAKPVKDILLTMAVLLLCWIPYFILLFPGCIGWDAFDQLAQAVNKPEFSWTKDTIVLMDENVIVNNHHPLLYTGVLKLTTLVGRLINSYEVAFSILCGIQAVCLSGSFAYMLYVMRKHSVSKRFYVAALIFCAINPLFPCYAMTIIKDTLFCILFILVAVQLYELLVAEKISVARGIVFLITLFVILFSRNNAVYILVLSAICVVLCYWQTKKTMVKLTSLILVPVLVFQIGIIGILYPAFKITPGSPREMLSVPFQQTVRYVKEHREEISQEDQRVITTVLNCDGDIDNLVDIYVPNHADSIKNRFNKNATTKDLAAYAKIWVKGLVKHPETYVEAYLNLHYGWLSLEGNPTLVYTSMEPLRVPEMLGGFEGYAGNYENRTLVNKIIDLFNRFPITNLFLEMAAYTWLYLFLLYFIIRKKNKQGFIVCTLVYFNLLICFVAPVAYMRYALPMVCTAPFATFIVLKKGDKENG